MKFSPRHFLLLETCQKFLCRVSIMAMLLVPAGAIAKDDVGKFGDKNNGIFVLGIVPDGQGGKVAGILIEFNKDDKDPMSLIFLERSEWERFAMLWEKSRIALTPKKDESSLSVAANSLLEFGDGITLEIIKESDGTIEFSMIQDNAKGNVENERIFLLDPSLFAAFNSRVLKVGKFFKR